MIHPIYRVKNYNELIIQMDSTVQSTNRLRSSIFFKKLGTQFLELGSNREFISLLIY